jgi:hypothetical protein
MTYNSSGSNSLDIFLESFAFVVLVIRIIISSSRILLVQMELMRSHLHRADELIAVESESTLTITS